MRRKTSVTLSEELVRQLDRASRKGESRSATIERMLRDALAGEARRAANARDLALINANADALNSEAEDVLGYQADV
jgi:metal-responsive CopG/Arc/MetJ family transcriptional regulator